MSNWIMYGRAERGAYGANWVKIASGATQQQWHRAHNWWSRVQIWDEIKTEKQ